MTSARLRLKAKGWTLTDAAKQIGVTHVHLMRVLNGQRPSNRTFDAAENLPDRSGQKINGFESMSKAPKTPIKPTEEESRQLIGQIFGHEFLDALEQARGLPREELLSVLLQVAAPRRDLRDLPDTIHPLAFSILSMMKTRTL